MKMNKMKEIRVAKITLNIGAGKDQEVLKKGLKLLRNITGETPIQTITNKRLAAWGLRPGLPIGCKVTLRKEKAIEVLKNLLKAKENILKDSQFDENGNVSFGIHEYIDIPNIKYDPEIGIMGFEICVSLERAGYRIKRRRLQKKRIPVKHRINKQEAMDFMKDKFNVQVGA
jgi:large subunit ribosomal protein L5